jgi:hypothetical protein
MVFLYNINPNSSFVTVFEVDDLTSEVLHDAKVYQIEMNAKIDTIVSAGFRKSEFLNTDPDFVHQLSMKPPLN